MKHLLVVALVTLTLIKVLFVIARGPAAIELDAAQYWSLSTRVMSGDIFFLGEKIAFRTPLFPWLLALVRGVSGTHTLQVLAGLQAACLVGATWIAAEISQRITKLPMARALTWLIYLPSISALTYSTATLSEPLFIFLLMLNVLSVLDYAREESAQRSAWMAITFALLVLTRPIAILLWVPHGVFLLMIHLRRRKRLGKNHQQRVKLKAKFPHLVITAGILALLVGPWVIRSHLLFGEFFLTKFVGRNVWIVTFQDGSGAGLELPNSASANQLSKRLETVGQKTGWRHTWHTSNALIRSGLNDPQTDDLMKKVAIDAIKENQKAFGYKAIRRTVNFWRTAVTDLPEPKVDDSYGTAKRWSLPNPVVEWWIDHRLSRYVWFNTSLMFVILLSGLIMIINRTTRPYGIWIAGILSYFCLITGTLEIPDYRYRIVVEPLACALVAAAVAWLIDRYALAGRHVSGSFSSQSNPTK